MTLIVGEGVLQITSLTIQANTWAFWYISEYCHSNLGSSEPVQCTDLPEPLLTCTQRIDINKDSDQNLGLKNKNEGLIEKVAYYL